MRDPVVIAAIITAIAAILTAIGSFIASIFATKRAASTATEIENLRFEQDRVRVLFEVNKDILNERLKALEEGSRAIQLCRDEVRKYLAGTAEGIEAAPGAARKSCSSLEETYMRIHYRLLEPDRTIMHEAKIVGTYLSVLLINALKAQEARYNAEKSLKDLAELQAGLLRTRDQITNVFDDLTSRELRSEEVLKRVQNRRRTG